MPEKGKNFFGKVYYTYTEEEHREVEALREERERLVRRCQELERRVRQLEHAESELHSARFQLEKLRRTLEGYGEAIGRYRRKLKQEAGWLLEVQSIDAISDSYTATPLTFTVLIRVSIPVPEVELYGLAFGIAMSDHTRNFVKASVERITTATPSNIFLNKLSFDAGRKRYLAEFHTVIQTRDIRVEVPESLLKASK